MCLLSPEIYCLSLEVKGRIERNETLCYQGESRLTKEGLVEAKNRKKREFCASADLMLSEKHNRLRRRSSQGYCKACTVWLFMLRPIYTVSAFNSLIKPVN